jgi:hypothetical protein
MLAHGVVHPCGTIAFNQEAFPGKVKIQGDGVAALSRTAGNV